MKKKDIVKRLVFVLDQIAEKKDERQDLKWEIEELLFERDHIKEKLRARKKEPIGFKRPDKK